MTHLNRRKFIKSAAAISTVTIVSPSVAFGSKANSAIRMGIIGCGGRGTNAITTMSENANVHIIAMADLFSDKLAESKVRLDAQNKKKGFLPIRNSETFVGSKAYLELLDITGY